MPMNRRSFLSTLAALPVVGPLVPTPAEVQPEPLPIETPRESYLMPPCALCGEDGHEAKVEEVEPRWSPGDFPMSHALIFVRYCENRPINRKIYPKRAEYYDRTRLDELVRIYK